MIIDTEMPRLADQTFSSVAYDDFISYNVAL